MGGLGWGNGLLGVRVYGHAVEDVDALVLEVRRRVGGYGLEGVWARHGYDGPTKVVAGLGGDVAGGRPRL